MAWVEERKLHCGLWEAGGWRREERAERQEGAVDGGRGHFGVGKGNAN